MKFYVILNVVFNDDTKDKLSIYSYDTEAEAVSAFYTYMGQYYNKSNVASVNVIAKNNLGGIYKNEFWLAPAPVVEPAEADADEDKAPFVEPTE